MDSSTVVWNDCLSAIVGTHESVWVKRDRVGCTFQELGESVPERLELRSMYWGDKAERKSHR